MKAVKFPDVTVETVPAAFLEKRIRSSPFCGELPPLVRYTFFSSYYTLEEVCGIIWSTVPRTLILRMAVINPKSNEKISDVPTTHYTKNIMLVPQTPPQFHLGYYQNNRRLPSSYSPPPRNYANIVCLVTTRGAHTRPLNLKIEGVPAFILTPSRPS